MLRQLRSAEKMKRILWFGLLILIIPSMVAFYGFGTGDLGTATRGPSEAVTIDYPDGTESVITPAELRVARSYLENQLQRYSQEAGLMLDPLAMSELTSNRAVVDQAINLDILRHYAEQNGLTATMDEVVQQLHQVTTADQRRQLVEMWRSQGRTPEMVLEEERRSRLLQKAADAIGERTRVTYYEAWKDYENQRETLVADFVKFNPSDYLSSVSLTQEGLNAYFQENIETYRVPDQVIYEYVLVRKDDLQSSVTLSEDEITSHYNGNREDFRLPRKIEASQIFLKVPTPDELNTTSPAAITSATLEITKKANDIYERAAKGEDFASLADMFTEEENFPPRADAGTTASDTQTTAGGNLGVISEEIAQTWYGDQWTSTVLAANPGSITRPIRTAQGFAIVQVRNIIEGEVQPLEDVRAVVENQLREEKAQPLFEEMGERLEEVSSNVSGNLQRFAEVTSTTVQRTPRVGVGEPFIRGIGMLGEFQDAVEYLEKGEISDVLSDNQRHLVLQIAEEFPSTLPELEDVRARVEQAYKLQLAVDKAREKAEELLTRSTNFNAFVTAVNDASTTYTTSRPFTRMEAAAIFGGPTPDFAHQSAGIEKGAIQMTAIGRPGQQQSFVVWHAAQVNAPSQTEFANELSDIVDRLSQRKRETLVLEYIRDQRQQLENNITINESFL